MKLQIGQIFTVPGRSNNKYEILKLGKGKTPLARIRRYTNASTSCFGTRIVPVADIINWIKERSIVLRIPITGNNIKDSGINVY